MYSEPSFVENMTFYEMDGDKSQLEQKEAMLKNLTAVFNLAAHNYRDLGEIVNAYLEAGREIFGLETGIVSNIINDTYTVIDVVSNVDAIKPGDEYPIEGTYCYEVYSRKKVVCFPHVGAILHLKNHPVYVNLKLEAYLSAPIEVGGELYGTLNFSSTHIRTQGFSEHERDLITLMAKAIGNFILLRDRDEKLKQANTKLKKFVGFVAHDLRNPLGVIQTMAKMGLKKGIPEERIPVLFDRIHLASSGALNFVYSILDLAALGTGKVTPQRSSISFQQIVDEAFGQLTELNEAAHSTIVNRFDSELMISADKSLMTQVFVNLLSNALKYSPPDSQIEIQAEQLPHCLTISVSNPVDPELHSDFDGGRYKSVGFGLEIADEIIQAHNSKLVTAKLKGKFTISFTLANN